MSSKIFIIASERSGTNLLRTLIGRHKQVSAPVAPHLFDSFYSLLRYYGNLGEAINAVRLMTDVLTLANHSYHDWKLAISAEELVKEFKVKSLAAVVNAVYMKKAVVEGKNSYCSKGIHNFDYVHYIRQEFPDAKFIYLVRDPRDHVASWMRTPLFMHTPYQVISKWNNEQNKCLTLKSIYPNDVHLIRYEDIITDPRKSMDSLLKFLGLELDENCYSTDIKNRESERNEFWKNLSKPIISDNKKKYLKTISKKDLLIVESLAKENMTTLGYFDFDTNANWKKGNKYLFKGVDWMKTRLSKLNNKSEVKAVRDGIRSKGRLMDSIRTKRKQEYFDSRN